MLALFSAFVLVLAPLPDEQILSSSFSAFWGVEALENIPAFFRAVRGIENCQAILRAKRVCRQNSHTKLETPLDKVERPAEAILSDPAPGAAS